MTQQSFSSDASFSHNDAERFSTMAAPFDRSEMFALGAAAGAIVVAAISQYLESRKPDSALEQAQAQGQEALETVKGATKRGKRRARGTLDRVSEQVGAALSSASDTKRSAKQGTRRGMWLGAKRALERAGEDPYAVSGSVEETLKEKLGELRGDAASKTSGLGATLKGALGLGAAAAAADAVKGRAARAIDRSADVDPYAVSGSVRETLKEQLDQARSGARGLGTSLKGLAASTGETTRGYAKEAQHYLEEAHLGEKARHYGDVATEAARHYSDVAAEKTKDLVSTAQKSLKEAHLDERLRDVSHTLSDYTTEAAKVTSKAAKQGAVKVSAGASHLAEATSEGARDLGKGVQKGVKRTRRRTKWGIRAFVIGLAVGLLTAPRSGQATRDTVTSFVEDLLDVFITGEEKSPIAR